MRDIDKGVEPQSLTEHRASQHSDFDNYVGKGDLRVSLTREQHGLCCYCMGRIRTNSDSIKIEHWRCQAHHPTECLNYNNLLGACIGGEGLPGDQQYCDTKKGDDALRWNPAIPAHRVASRLTYDLDGTIRSTDHTFDQQLNTVLNLNLPWLRNNRKGVLDGLLAWWRVARPVSNDRLQRELDRRVNPNGPVDLPPYCEVAVWWLRRKLGV